MEPYRIAFELRPQYLRVDVTGENTIETIRRYVTDTRAECARFGMWKVLAVVNLSGPGLSMLDIYKAASAGADDTAGTPMRAAYVELNPVRSNTNMQLAESIAATRGIPVRTFRDIATAEAWLLNAPPHA